MTALGLRRYTMTYYDYEGWSPTPSDAAWPYDDKSNVDVYLAAEADAALAERDALLRECAEHFKTLREAGVFVWPNHPLNPEARIAALTPTRSGE